MSIDVKPERTSSTQFDKGLYLLRYASSGAADPPYVLVRPSYGSEDTVQIITPPSSTPAMLPKPGSVLVLVADQAASIQMTVQSRVRGGSLDAQLRLEPLHDTAQADQVQASAVAPADGGDLGHIELVGHVSRRGDVPAARGRWIAGPDAPAPIEGIEVIASASAGLEYQVVVRGAERWSEWMRPGQYAGTKGQALALAGVRLRLSEIAARTQILKASALFLGSAVVDQSGPTIELRSVAGHDPLIGLMLDVVAREIHRADAVKPVSTPTVERKGRVRVFRAGVEQRLG